MLKIVFLFLIHINQAQALPRADFATFWGGFNRVTKCSASRGELRKIKISGLRNEVKIYLSTQNKPAPLIIIYPGVFAEVNHKMVFHMAEEMEKLGVHVLILPNIAASSYLGNRNETKLNPWQEEQEAQKEMLMTGLKEINSELITSFNILAESLGIWQAVMMLEVSPKPIKNMILMWPPLNLGNSLNRFDEELQKTKSTFDHCSFWWKWPYAILSLKRDHMPPNVSNQDEACYGSYILHEAFVKGIRNVTKQTYKLKEKNLDQLPENFNGFARSTMKDLAPLLEDRNKTLHLETWIPLFKKLNLKPIIYTSADDFLNQEKDWDIFKNDQFFNESLTIYPWGGHSGRAAEPEFWEDLRNKIKNKI